MASYIDWYLVELESRLTDRIPATALHSLLVETEDHLRSSVAEKAKQGMPVDRAERASLEEFGSPERLAASVLPQHQTDKLGFWLQVAGYGILTTTVFLSPSLFGALRRGMMGLFECLLFLMLTLGAILVFLGGSGKTKRPWLVPILGTVLMIGVFLTAVGKYLVSPPDLQLLTGRLMNASGTAREFQGGYKGEGAAQRLDRFQMYLIPRSENVQYEHPTTVVVRPSKLDIYEKNTPGPVYFSENVEGDISSHLPASFNEKAKSTPMTMEVRMKSTPNKAEAIAAWGKWSQTLDATSAWVLKKNRVHEEAMSRRKEKVVMETTWWLLSMVEVVLLLITAVPVAGHLTGKAMRRRRTESKLTRLLA